MKKQWLLAANPILISIHPIYVEKILSGEKKVEFRRRGPKMNVQAILIYATSPRKELAALVEVDSVLRSTSEQLWRLSLSLGGGISKRELFAYLKGSKDAVGLRLMRQIQFHNGIDPKKLFGSQFRAPQSFRYLKQHELLKLNELVEGRKWQDAE